MASKYRSLKGKIPEQQTERQENLTKAISALQGKTIAELTVAYNSEKSAQAELTAKAKAIGVTLAALELLIRKKLEATEADGVSMHGFTWSEKYEPYPVAEDPTAIVAFMRTNGMEDQLELRAGELASRLENYVKEEALNNTLQIVTKTIPNPDVPGEEIETTEVFSNIPGVRVYLHPSLSRVKSGK